MWSNPSLPAVEADSAMASIPPSQASPGRRQARVVIRASLSQAGILVLAAGLLSYTTIALDLRWTPAKTAGELSVKEARARQSDFIWVDVRNPERFENAHIPGAIHFDEANELDGIESIRRQWNKARKLCVYGEGIGSARAERVARLLKTALATREVYLLEGGWAAWPRE
jgi:rhodanese-related sulfurtransferase